MGAKKVMVEEAILLKALRTTEELIKGSGQKQVGGEPSMPSSAGEANGALGQHGDVDELAAKNNAILDSYAEKSVTKAMEDEDDDQDEDDDEDDEDMGKSEDSIDDDDEEESEKDGGGKVYKNARKSMIADTMQSLVGEGTDGGMDMLAFENLIDTVADSDNKLRKSVYQMNDEQRQFNQVLAKALSANMQMTAAVKKSLDGLMNTPQQRRSYLSKAEVNERFDTGARGDGQQQLNRNDVLKAMRDLSDHQHPLVTGSQLIKFEASGQLDPPVRQAVWEHINKKSA
jgi:hypothetical protein